VTLVDGITLLDDAEILAASHLRFFVTLDKAECYGRRSRRSYDPPDVPGYFERVVWPEYEAYRRRCQKIARLVILDGAQTVLFNSKTVTKAILASE